MSSSFFESAASSFHPVPSASRHATRNHHRPQDSLPPGMDPQPTDPSVHFIHPPFTHLPTSHHSPDGLTYALMAENPEWFLDASDFISQHNTNPHTIPYPPFLEPPRGWCPAKKKDLKERGPEGWPEGEEPRLRCTFCRRTYAGVNAKSMWRRHVFEKHKIAMANRRDGNDRPRGRGSGKENRQVASRRPREDTHDSLVSILVTPQTQPDTASHKSRFRAGKTPEPSRPRRESRKDAEIRNRSSTTQPSHSEHSNSSADEADDESHNKVFTPPLTPHASSSEPSNVMHESSDGIVGTSPLAPHPVIPESPYDPLQTPSFRHSPPRLPSDQPWRYPSPSHPLHLQSRELSLSMLLPDTSSPIVRSMPPSTPNLLIRQSSPLSMTRPTTSHMGSLGTPASGLRFSLPPSKSSILRGHILSSPTKRRRRGENQFEGSPLAPFRRSVTRQKKPHSEISEAWLADSYILSSALENDPFQTISAWSSIDGNSVISPIRHPKALPEVESPVLRSGCFPSVGLGVGLMAAFDISRDEILSDVAATDLKELLSPSGLVGEKRPESIASRAPTNESSSGLTPPTKKRRMSTDSIGHS